MLDDAVQPISGVTEAGEDVADIVELLVEAGQHEGAGDVQLIDQFLEPGEPLGRRDQADAGDVIGSALDQELHRRAKGAAGGEHRIEHVTLASRQVHRQPFRVRGRYQCLLIAHHTDKPNLGRRNQSGHALEHAEARPQDRYHQGPRGRQLHPDRSLQRCLNCPRHDTDVASCLVREQGDQLFGESPEGWGVGCRIPQHGELVTDKRVVDDA